MARGYLGFLTHVRNQHHRDSREYNRTDLMNDAVTHLGLGGKDLRHNMRLLSLHTIYGASSPETVPMGLGVGSRYVPESGFFILVWDDGEPWQSADQHEYVARIYLDRKPLPSHYDGLGANPRAALRDAHRRLADHPEFIRLRTRHFYGVAH